MFDFWLMPIAQDKHKIIIYSKRGEWNIIWESRYPLPTEANRLNDQYVYLGQFYNSQQPESTIIILNLRKR